MDVFELMDYLPAAAKESARCQAIGFGSYPTSGGWVAQPEEKKFHGHDVRIQKSRPS
jgi:hypothetical protein